MLKKIVFIILITCIISILPLSNSKAVEKNNSEYLIVIEDDANLLTEEEEQNLKIKMEELKEFGNVMFKTTNTYNSSSSLRYIQNYYYSRFENRSGLAFYIDMNNRQLCLCATGGLDELITSSKCDTIMDNVYRYARKGNYYSCAIETFSRWFHIVPLVSKIGSSVQTGSNCQGISLTPLNSRLNFAKSPRNSACLTGSFSILFTRK